VARRRPRSAVAAFVVRLTTMTDLDDPGRGSPVRRVHDIGGSSGKPVRTVPVMTDSTELAEVSVGYGRHTHTGGMPRR
jgi:hypothetical protein